MFTRLFGETEEIQLQYLKTRVIITLISLVLFPTFPIVMLFVWGWNTVKSLFGITSIGIIFSGNVIIGSVIFVFYVIFAYCAGMFVALLGIGRYIYLKVKEYKRKKGE